VAVLNPNSVENHGRSRSRSQPTTVSQSISDDGVTYTAGEQTN